MLKVVSPFASRARASLAKDGSIGYITLTLKDSAGDLTVDEAHDDHRRGEPGEGGRGCRSPPAATSARRSPSPATHLSEVVGHPRGDGHPAAHVRHASWRWGCRSSRRSSASSAALSVITLLGQVVDVPTTAPALATMIGLGVGIDYGLFIVTRHRDQLRDGMEVRESIARATATSGGAVVFAGSTVIIALLSLALAGIPLVTTLGYTAAIVVLIAVLGGDHADAGPARPARPADQRAAAAGHAGTHHDERPHGWQRWARLVADRPWPALVAGVVVLAVLARPLRKLHLGQTDVGALPDRHPGAPGLRPHDRRLRRRLQRADARRRRPLGKPAKADQTRSTRSTSQSSSRSRRRRPGHSSSSRSRPAWRRRAWRRTQPSSRRSAGPAAAQQAGQQITSQADASARRPSSRDRPAAADSCARTCRRPRTSSRSPSRWSTSTAPRPSTRSIADQRARPRAGPRTSSNTLRDTVIPKATKGQGMTRRRRRHDRRLHRPRQADQRRSCRS